MAKATEISLNKANQIIKPRRNWRLRLFGRYNINAVGFMFVLPAILLIASLIFLPIVKAIFYSFFDWDGVNATFTGVRNYSSLFSSTVFHVILRNNLILLLSVPFWVVIPLFAAYLLYLEPPGWRIFRVIFFVPTALSWVIIGIVWRFFFSYDGQFNQFLGAIGLPSLIKDWLSDPTIALFVLIATAIWAWFGTGVIIFSVGMSTIPTDIMEAAAIEGCRGWRLLFYILLPSLRKFIEFYTVYSIVMAFTQMFGLIYVMTQGGPGYFTTTAEYQIYMTAFQNMKFGMASAVGVVLFVAVLLVSLVQQRIMRGDD
ncbi:sugar ABC transporter permease [Paenibacillus baekrokdamisoli]|uniref:Sugar ABC transporter permease n=1 Tax=Paenibacillus baekrokdamisoli TaxID=1712516 RepID=A0A3G9IVT3_9BACL|nr:sugar ABC transporter permease [Paenibacillus baekrokdamisoli]MBB3073451.1 ABC-type sugar transport system permease subunit [Paenibacillus baekrokdamisoli]BBH20245.1 sugar ABC transporter permease [Paenibacillus baekrokdamisoli]